MWRDCVPSLHLTLRFSAFPPLLLQLQTRVIKLGFCYVYSVFYDIVFFLVFSINSKTKTKLNVTVDLQYL